MSNSSKPDLNNNINSSLKNNNTFSSLKNNNTFSSLKNEIILSIGKKIANSISVKEVPHLLFGLTFDELKAKFEKEGDLFGEINYSSGNYELIGYMLVKYKQLKMPTYVFFLKKKGKNMVYLLEYVSQYSSCGDFGVCLLIDNKITKKDWKFLIKSSKLIHLDDKWKNEEIKKNKKNKK